MSSSTDNKFLTFLGNLINPVDTPLAIGPKLVPFNYVINAQKTGTIIIMYILMVYFNNFSLGAWVYLALHGTYGLVWFMKDMVFPDKSFQVKLTIPGTIMTIALLLLYWVIGFEMVSGIGDQNPSPRKIFSCFFIFTFGSLLMMLTDFQKYITLKYKKGLIDNLFLARCRNTNYLGEIMIYLTFAMINGRIEGYIILLIVWIFAFSLRLYIKEQSLSKKNGYEKYRKNSYIILFKFFDRDIINFLFYLATVIFIIICLKV